jgi:hypothetical protein
MDANKQMKKARHKGGGENDIEIEFEDRDTTMQHTSFVDKKGPKKQPYLQLSYRSQDRARNVIKSLWRL